MAPLAPSEIAGFADTLLTEVPASYPSDRALTVADAVQRALAENSAIRARRAEVSLADAKVAAQAAGILPNLTAESEHTWRSPALASRSSRTAPFTTSSDASQTTQAATIAWSPLDLGLSYLRTRQASDKAWQQREEIRRVETKIMEETRETFWRRVALERLELGLARIDREVTDALMLGRRAAADTSVDPMIAITLQRDILTLQREVRQVQGALASSRGQLAHLIHADVSRLDTRLMTDVMPPQATSAAHDYRRALMQRPEIRQAMYDLRMSYDELDATVLQALPTALLSSARSTDSNSYLKQADWSSGAIGVSANITQLLRLADTVQTVEAQRVVHRQLAIVTASSIVTQVIAARAHMAASERALRAANELARNQARVFAQVDAAVRAGKAPPQNRAREALARVLADVRYALAFGERDSAVAAYLTALGDGSNGDAAP
jgi:outer membrane protein TolC